MLCPKCGFISFDHLLVCEKCKQDLSQIGADLHGTATDAECRHFLGLVLKETAIPVEDQAPRAEILEPQAVLVEQNDDEADEMLIVDLTNDGLGEEDAASTADEPPALEFELDEIPHLDISDFESAAPEEKIPVEAENMDLEEAVSLDLYLEETADRGEESAPIATGPPPDEQSAIDGISLAIDQSSLTLTSDQEPLELSLDQEEETPPLYTQSPAEDKSSAPLTIDLNDIDLSDLVHDHNETLPDSDGAMASLAEEGLDFTDTMDLSLFIGEDQETPVAVSDPLTDYTGLEPIDLTLMDEALVELAIDPSRQEQSFPQKSPGPELELSMEDK